MTETDLPPHYVRAIRTLLRFAVVLTIVGLLSGVLFQESAKKLDIGSVTPGFRLQVTQNLALVHGHALVSGALLPIAMAGALLLARRIGGSELGPRPIAWLLRGYLPLLCVSLGLMLYKGYHNLLSARFGEQDLAVIDERFFGGLTPLRHTVYGIAHTGMVVSLGVFVVALWRSLGRRAE